MNLKEISINFPFVVYLLFFICGILCERVCDFAILGHVLIISRRKWDKFLYFLQNSFMNCVPRARVCGFFGGENIEELAT